VYDLLAPVGYFFDDGVVCPDCAERRDDDGEDDYVPIALGGLRVGETCLDCDRDFDGLGWVDHRWPPHHHRRVG